MEHEVLKQEVHWQQDQGAVGRAVCNCGWSAAVGPFGSMIRCDLALETSIALHLDRAESA